MTRAAMWLCAGKGKEGPLNIVRRALEVQRKVKSNPVSREEEITWVSCSLNDYQRGANVIRFVPSVLVTSEDSGS